MQFFKAAGVNLKKKRNVEGNKKKNVKNTEP